MSSPPLPVLYCTLTGCKKPQGHHNTVDHPCGNCKQLGHSRELCGPGNLERVIECFVVDGRGLNTCRICGATDHVAQNHSCEKCGIHGLNDCPTCGNYEHRRLIHESRGDFIPREEWCKKQHVVGGVPLPHNCPFRCCHTSSYHVCASCGFRHSPNMQHNSMKCPVCKTTTCIPRNCEYLSPLDADRGCDNCTVNIRASSDDDWRGLVSLRCNHVVCADCTHALTVPVEFRNQRASEFGVVVPDDAEAKMIRETGFLGGFGPRLYRVSENYILIRSAPGSEVALRSIRHLDSGARNSLVARLKSLGFRDGIEISASSGFINMVQRANTPGDPLHAATMAMFGIRTPAEPMPQPTPAPAQTSSRDATMAQINEMLARSTSEAASADGQHGDDDPHA